jgi:hypothetical protein
MASEFLQPEFIATLFQKLCELRAGSAKGNPLYGALHFYRHWSQDQIALKKMREGTHGELSKRLQTVLRINAAHCRKCVKLLITETLRIYRTADLAAHQRLNEVFIRNTRHERSTYRRLNWPECFCAVTLQSLVKGKVPTKKEVREAAFHEMALRLLPAGAGKQVISTKIESLRKYGPSRPARIFSALGLANLPEAVSRPGEAYRH